MSAQMIQTVGSALLHFLWQGAALAVLLSIGISLTRNPRVRYGLGVAALALMALCPFLTLLFLNRPGAAGSVTTVDSSAIAPAITNITVALTNEAPVTTFDLLSCFVWIWCSGVCLFAVRALGGWLVLQNLRRTAQEAIAPALLERCRRLQQRIGIKALVRYAYSEVVDAPAVVGWFRPLILIPMSALSGLSMEQIEAILAHELAHIRRYDALVNLFQIAVETVLFYHPAVWWVNRVIRTERENCCDDLAVAVCGNATEYARALASMGGARPSWVMAANGGALKARVARLLGMQKISHGIPRGGLAVLALLCGSCILVAAAGYRQDPPPPPQVPVPPPAMATAPEPPAAPEAPMAKLAAPRAPNPPALNEFASLGALEREEQAPPAPPAVEEQKGPSYIDGLASAGLSNLAVDDLIALKVQGVTPDYVRQIKAAGFETTVRDLISLKVQGISPEYIRDIRATGLKPTVHELVGLKVQGITPEFVRALQSAGLGDLKLRDFISAKVQGVTPEFIAKVRAHGFKDLTIRQLISLKMADVF